MSNPVAIITGGAGGMGLATAKIMGADHIVVISDVKQEALDAAATKLNSLGITAKTFVCDITDRVAVNDLFEFAMSLGQLAAVVHTAGVSPLMGSPEFIIRVNAIGTVNITEAALKNSSDGFALVNVASIAGHMTPKFALPTRQYKYAFGNTATLQAKLTKAASRGPKKMRSGSAYSISKSFVIWYSAKMAAAFGSKGARIVSVSPGTFDTSMGRLEEASGSAKLTEIAALKRFGTSEEIAELLAFCASKKPGYLTGVDILCDGGTKAGMSFKDLVTMARGS